MVISSYDSNFCILIKIMGVVVGTDEAGRGPAAGGVFAAAVYFPEVTETLIVDLARLMILRSFLKLQGKSFTELF